MLGQRLKDARIEAGLSQRQLCGQIITRNMLSQIESGKARPSMQTLTYLAQMLGKPVSWFLEEQATQLPAREEILDARQQYARGEYERCIEALEEMGLQEDPERLYLYALCDLALARQAIAQGKLRYARSLLEKAGQIGAGSVYFTPAQERERLLLLYQAQPERAGELAKALPSDDRELLLRAEGALAAGDFAAAEGFLSAVIHKNETYHYLLGKALLGQKRYVPATEQFILGEKAFPKECAQALETCYREQGDYKMAYHYACKQRLE